MLCCILGLVSLILWLAGYPGFTGTCSGFRLDSKLQIPCNARVLGDYVLLWRIGCVLRCFLDYAKTDLSTTLCFVVVKTISTFFRFYRCFPLLSAIKNYVLELGTETSAQQHSKLMTNCY